MTVIQEEHFHGWIAFAMPKAAADAMAPMRAV
jgi:hypothetical protein